MKMAWRNCAASIVCLGMLSSCGSGRPLMDAQAAAAKVNGQIIPARRLEAAMERAAARTNAHEPAPGREAVLQRLIDQELLVQAALARKLDRDPNVQRAAEGARRDALAHAYLESLIADAGGSEPDAKTFYERNPALFARRRIYQLREIVLEDGVEKLPGLGNQLAVTLDLNLISAWLKSQGVLFRIRSEVKPAEELPLVYLSRIAGMHRGEVALLSGAAGSSIVRLDRFEDAPLSEEQAATVIEPFLRLRRRLDVAQHALAELREKARIEYASEAVDPADRGAARRTSAGLQWNALQYGPAVLVR